MMCLLTILLQGCATESKSIELGGGIGLGTGAALGAIADPGKHGQYRTRNVIVGSALGGMAGMISGALLHEETEKQKREAFAKGQAAKPDQAQASGSMPELSQPKIESHWIEGHITGNRYIDGHYEYVITEPSHWEAK